MTCDKMGIGTASGERDHALEIVEGVCCIIDDEQSSVGCDSCLVWYYFACVELK